jgi:hypothetical protein
MAYKFIVTTVLVHNPENIALTDINPTVSVFDEIDLDKAIALCKFDDDKNNAHIKITVETEYEEHSPYKDVVEGLKLKGNKFGNIPCAKYIVCVEHTMESGNVYKTWFLSTISFHNI